MGGGRPLRTALITGIAGQDGFYMASYLKDRGYRVCGLVRQHHPGDEGVREVLPFVEPIVGDLRERRSLVAAIEDCEPDEIYNLAAYSSVSASWEEAETTAEVTALGPLRLLEAIRACGRTDDVRVYQASSSEMFGRALTTPQNETTPFAPMHPYAASKVFAHTMTVMYRETYGMFATGGILFNHESPRRGQRFVTQKIASSVARISLGLQEHLALGDLEVRRDWGYAPEYVEAMWLMLQQPEPDDYVIATGVSHSVRDFVATAFLHVGIEDWQSHVHRDPHLLRPAEIADLVGDSSKAQAKLGWRARTPFEDLVGLMVDAELERGRQAQGSAAQPAGKERGET